MTQQLILRIKNDGEPAGLYRFDAQSNSCESTVIKTWSDNQLSAEKLIILLPASWVYHTSVQIASKNSELLSKSIPFAVEEELSNDVDDNYYAYRINEDGSQDVVAIEKSLLDQLYQKIKQHSLQVEAIHSEAEWIPAAVNYIHIWQDFETSLLRFGNDAAMQIENQQLEKMIPVFGADKKGILSNKPLQFKDINIPIKTELSAALCCQVLFKSNAIDLYVDEIKETNTKNVTGHWHSVKWIAAALIMSWVIIQSYQWFLLSGDVAALKQSQKNLLIQKFPDAVASEQVDPYAALQSRFKLQTSSLVQTNNNFMSAIHGIGASLKQQQTIQVVNLRLIDGKIELQIKSPAMSNINGFHQVLQQQLNNFTVQIGVNELTEDNSFRSILTMVQR